jgi:hypothetical protein
LLKPGAARVIDVGKRDDVLHAGLAVMRSLKGWPPAPMPAMLSFLGRLEPQPASDGMLPNAEEQRPPACQEEVTPDRSDIG